MKKKEIQKPTKNKVHCADAQNIANIALSAIALILMVYDLCMEFAFGYAKDKGASQFDTLKNDWLNKLHIALAAIEAICVIVVLILTSISYSIYKKNKMINRTKLDLFICNWVFASLYIVLTIVATSRINHLKDLEQAFLAGFCIFPIVGLTTVSPIIYHTFRK